MSDKIISRNKENFVSRIAKGIGYWFLGEFMCFFMCLPMQVLMRGSIILKMFVAFCTLMITMGLYFNWAHYAAKRDRNAVKFHNMDFDGLMPLKMSIAAPIFSYIMLIALYLCKMGAIPDVFNFYMIGNIWMLPFIKMFTDTTSIAGVSWFGMAGMTLLVLVQPAVIYATYVLTYKDVDIMKILMYKK